jgi:hypothetical protein
MVSAVAGPASFSSPFRAQVASWMARTGAPRAGEAPRFYSLGVRRLILAYDVEVPRGAVTGDVIVAAGNVRLGDGGELRGPVFAGGRLETGKRCRLLAAASNGRILLGAESSASDWLEARGEILLRPGASARALHAPEIAFAGEAPAGEAPPPRGLLRLGRPSEGGHDFARWRTVPGFRPERLAALDAETWFYDGSLDFASPLELRGHLIVRGSFRCAAGSLLEADVKTGAALDVGGGSLVRGHLTSLAALSLGGQTYFSGNLQAGGDISLAAGTRGFHPTMPVRLECKGEMLAGAGVVLRGEARAERRIAAPAPVLEPGHPLFQYREIC